MFVIKTAFVQFLFFSTKFNQNKEKQQRHTLYSKHDKLLKLNNVDELKCSLFIVVLGKMNFPVYYSKIKMNKII
jgi:hypothetical protein